MIFTLKGEVIHGKKLGRTIGFPTANISCEAQEGIPSATYKVNGKIDGKIYKGVGTYREEIELFEAHFFDFEADIYGQEIEIVAYAKIRDNMKFQSLDEIKNQIKKDVQAAKQSRQNVLTFGTFDVFHKGHQHYLNQSKMYGDSLITIVSTESNRKKITGLKPHNSLDIRYQKVLESGIADKVEKGSEQHPMQWLNIYTPSVICLGYDQNSFVEDLHKHIEQYNLDIHVERIDAFEPEIYKSSKLL